MIDQPFNVPDTPSLTLSREQAATRQLEVAILALTCGDWDVAITLAGAAEGMLDGKAGLFPRLRDHPYARGLHRKKAWIPELNRELYWLKHGGHHVMTIERRKAVRMIVRATSKIQHPTPRIRAFAKWFADHKDAVLR